MTDLVVLAPHLDDAALSCGARIHDEAADGRSVVVVTVATADPPSALPPLAEEVHRRWNLGPDAVAVRRAEDQEACHRLGAELEHWGELDAVYRRHPETAGPLYPTLESLFQSPHPIETDRVETLARRLRALPSEARVLAPLAVGRHVDHVLLRRAAELALGRLGVTFYEDFPYARSRKARIQARGFRRWRRTVHAVRPLSLEAKIEAVLAYGSQLGTMWNDEAALRRDLEVFTRYRGGERYWRRR